MSTSGFLAAAVRQAQLVENVGGRPWPLPDAPWSQAQTRTDMLGAHWVVPFGDLARMVPEELRVDTFAGEAWLGIAAFRLESLRLRGLPPLPGLSTHLQLDVCTYVTLAGRPGLWLFSLETESPLLAEAAKRAHRLPAYRARISVEAADGGTRFSLHRDGLAFGATYRAAGDPFTAVPGTLEHFLTERYCLYTADGGRLYRVELHHRPWRLRQAAAEIGETTIAPLALEGEPCLLHAACEDMLIWPLEEL